MKLQLIYTTLVLLGAITNAKNIPTPARSLQDTCEDLVEAVEQCEMNNGGKTDLGAMQCYLGFSNTLDFGMQATCENFKKQDWCKDLEAWRKESCSPECKSEFVAAANCMLYDCPDYQCSGGSKTYWSLAALLGVGLLHMI